MTEKNYDITALIRVDGRDFTFSDTCENDLFSARLEITGGCVRLLVTPASLIGFESIAVDVKRPVSDNERIFLNGYQSWTDSCEVTSHDRLRGIDHIPKALVRKYSFDKYGDYNFCDYSDDIGELHGFTYAYIRNGSVFTLFGSLSERNGFTMISVLTDTDTVRLSLECEGAEYSDEFAAIDAVILDGNEDEVFDRWFELMQITPPTAKPISGYTSWYRHYENISESSLMHDLEALASSDANCDIFQIDDGYQTAVGDWLSIDSEKFPNGIKPLCGAIHENGFKAGLWLAPFVCEKDSELFRNHPDWILKDENSSPLSAGCNWSGSYALDIYNEEVRAYLREVFRTVFDDWGFDLVKLDFLYACCIRPQNGKSRGQVMCEGMDLLRELCGDKLILGCGVPLGAAFGKVDYCRIGCDVGLSWNDNPIMRLTHRERVSTRNSILNTVFRRQLDGRAFLNDPDVYLLRDDGLSLMHCQKQCLAIINHLCGSVYFTSDDVSSYSERQKKLLRTAGNMRRAKLLEADMTGSTVTMKLRLGTKEKVVRLDAANGKLF